MSSQELDPVIAAADAKRMDGVGQAASGHMDFGPDAMMIGSLFLDSTPLVAGRAPDLGPEETKLVLAELAEMKALMGRLRANDELWREVVAKLGLSDDGVSAIAAPSPAKAPAGMDMVAAFDDTIALAEQRGMAETRGGLSLDHLKDMRTRIAPSFSPSKLGRWLGWAQCAVVAAGVSTLDDMKDINLRHADRRA